MKKKRAKKKKKKNLKHNASGTKLNTTTKKFK